MVGKLVSGGLSLSALRLAGGERQLPCGDDCKKHVHLDSGSVIHCTNFNYTMDEYTQAKCRAAENAALLVCLREQPSVPKENKQPACGTQDELTLRREVQLIEDFAFISSTKTIRMA